MRERIKIFLLKKIEEEERDEEEESTKYIGRDLVVCQWEAVTCS